MVMKTSQQFENIRKTIILHSIYFPHKKHNVHADHRKSMLKVCVFPKNNKTFSATTEQPCKMYMFSKKHNNKQNRCSTTASHRLAGVIQPPPSWCLFMFLLEKKTNCLCKGVLVPQPRFCFRWGKHIGFA